MTFAHTEGFTTDDPPPGGPKAKSNGKDHGHQSGKTSADQSPPSLGFDPAAWDAAAAFDGRAPDMRWLVQGTIPLGVGGVVAAAGDTGKSFLMLELCMRVAWRYRREAMDPPILGGGVKVDGTAVYLTAEDSKESVHRRLELIDSDGSLRRKAKHKLYIVPLPSVEPPEGQSREPFAIVAAWKGQLVRTSKYEALRTWLLSIKDLKLVVLDPLQALALVDMNDQLHAQFVATTIADLSASTGATIIVTHHVRKAQEPPRTVEEARQMIRGSTAIVDGLRFAIALWPVSEADAKSTCKKLDQEFKPHSVIRGAVVKSNDNANRSIRTMLRQDNGILRDVTEALIVRNARPGELLTAMENAIARLAIEGRPVTKTGANGVFERRAELGFDLKELSKHQLVGITDELLAAKRVIQAMASGSTTVKWLDLPDGPFACGEGVFVYGASTAKPGPKDRRKPAGGEA